MKLIFVVVLAALTLACGPSQAQTPAAPSDTPKHGGRLSLRIPNDPFTWDLSDGGKAGPMGAGMGWAYNTVLGFKAGPDVQYHEQILRPELAESWEVSPDGKTYTFKLRSGVKWASMPPTNGRDLTAADVKWTYEYWSRTGEIKDKKLKRGDFDYMFEGLERIETPDPRTVVVRFEKPFVPFLTYSASDYNPIVPKEIFEQDGHLKDRIAGSGPWQLDVAASQKGTRWVWKKNPPYWEQGKPYIDEIYWLTIPDESASLAAFQAKQADFLDSTHFRNYRAVQDLQRAVPTAVINEVARVSASHFHTNVKRPPLDDIRVRRAIFLAIDRDELSRVETGRESPWAPAGALRGLFTDAEVKQMLKYDPAEAKRLLDQAGYPNGLTLPWELTPAYGDAYVSSVQLIQAQLKKAGINIEIKSMERADFTTRRRQGDFYINRAPGECGERFEYDASIAACYKTGAGNNYGGVSDPELDRMLDAQRAEVNPEKRKEIIRSAVRRIHEMAYSADLFYAPQWEAWHPALKNYAPNVGANGMPLENAWLDR